MQIEVLLIVRATEKAVKVCVDWKNRPLIWIPRRSIRYGFDLEAGESGILIDVETWVIATKLQPQEG